MEKKVKKIILIIFVAVLLVLAILFFSKFLSTVLISAVIAYLLLPLTKAAEKRCARSVAIIVSFLLVISVIIALVTFVIPVLSKEASSFAFALPELISSAENFFYQITDFAQKWGINLDSLKERILTSAMPEVDFSKIFSFFASLLLVPVVTFYFLRDRENIAEHLVFAIPEKAREKTVNACKKINGQLRDYLFSQLLIIACLSALTSIVLLLFGYEYAFILGLFMGVFNIIPYLGPLLGSIPIVLISLKDGLGGLVLGILISVGVQQIDNLIIHPLVIGKTVKLNPLTVLLTVLAGGEALGVWGMMISVPVFIILKIIFKEVYAYFSEKKVILKKVT